SAARLRASSTVPRLLLEPSALGPRQQLVIDLYGCSLRLQPFCQRYILVAPYCARREDGPDPGRAGSSIGTVPGPGLPARFGRRSIWEISRVTATRAAHRRLRSAGRCRLLP